MKTKCEKITSALSKNCNCFECDFYKKITHFIFSSIINFNLAKFKEIADNGKCSECDNKKYDKCYCIFATELKKILEE